MFEQVFLRIRSFYVAVCVRTSVAIYLNYLPDEDKYRFIDGVCPPSLPLAGSPLHIAVSIKDVRLIRYLLKNGLPSTRLNPHGRTPLHKAILEGFESGAALLLEHGARVNTSDRYGTPLLHCAVDRCTKELFSKLLIAGVDLTPQDNNGDDVRLFAQKRGRYDIVAEIDSFVQNEIASHAASGTNLD